MQIWNVLHAARCKCRMQKSSKIWHLGTIIQLCRALSSQLRHVSTIGKKLVKQQYLLQMSSKYGILRPASGWDQFTSLAYMYPCKFQRLSHLGSITARQSCSERQPNFAALNRGCHLCSARRPSRWKLAHILVTTKFPRSGRQKHKLDHRLWPIIWHVHFLWWWISGKLARKRLCCWPYVYTVLLLPVRNHQMLTIC